ncbi:MAG: hypothetical protein IJ174_00010 [Clostridia bacterium]|nr:hypothetical protein [Clostridia bacterium]
MNGLRMRLASILAAVCLAACLFTCRAGAADSFFDDAVFIGDSLTAQLASYVREQRSLKKNVLGEARFLSATNYSLTTAAKENLYGNVRLKVRGLEVTPQEGLQMLGAGKAFIMLGLNDHAGSSLATDINHYAMLINHIRALNPGIMIVVETMTPIQKHLQSSTLNQANLDRFNEELALLCAEMDVYFVDIATPLKNQEGFLDSAYAYAYNDNVHLNLKGLRLWVQALNDFADDMLPVLEAERYLEQAEEERLAELITPLHETEVSYPFPTARPAP